MCLLDNLADSAICGGLASIANQMEDKSEGKTRASQPSQEMPLFRRPGFAKNKARTNENPGQRILGKTRI